MPKYRHEFYAKRHKSTQVAAHAILDIAFDLVDIKSVVDLGCGTGTWLRTAQQLGANTVLGVEGHWLNEDIAVIDPSCIRKQNLEETFRNERRFDLAISLEVAEHLSPKRADNFVVDLCALSDCVLFGAAIPGQGGTHHLNEQWHSYWARRFAALGYRAYDVIRWKIWSREDIATWYRQNIVVYCRTGSGPDTALAAVGQAVDDLQKLDVVHPAMFAHRVKPSLKGALRHLLKSAFNGLKRTHAGDLGSPLIPSPAYLFDYHISSGKKVP